MAKLTQTGQLLSDRLAEAGTLDSDTVCLLMQQLVEQVEQLHATGQLHRAISSSNVWVDQRGKATLQASQVEPLRCGKAHEAGNLPPELENIEELLLPVRIDQAKATLKKLGSTCDPRRVDLFQLGQLALGLLTGESASGYLMSPKIKAAVPAHWREWIDAALGYAPANRAASCEQLQESLKKMLSPDADQGASPTPPTGTGVDVHRDTPLFAGKAAARLANEKLPFTQLGHFRIDAKLGSGGMGDVYRGFDSRLDRTVAIKVLPRELARNDDFVQRFMSEARAAAQLVHPHIVPIYFIGEDQGTHFFAMQYVDGPSLAELLLSRKRLEVKQALKLVEQITAGLAEAHARGLIHRDIKPGNILLDGKTGKAKLADFGLVKSLGSSLQATATGVVMGTVDYISPEQGRGQAVDGRADLYSLGVLLYHLLSGKLPFVADSPTAMIFQHAYEKPTPLGEVVPEVPANVVAIVDRLLLKNPDDRYQSAETLADDLRTVRAGGEPTFDSVPVANGATQIILAPDFDFDSEQEKQLTQAFVPQVEQNWRTRMLALFNQHAPQALQDLQNTQQQVEGGIAVYTDRRNKLAALAEEARQIEKELAKQIAEQESAAAEARVRASKASSSADRKEAQRQYAQHQDAAKFLTSQLAEQKEQSEQIHTQLAQADTTLQKLRSQQQLLLARLETAQAGIAVSNRGVEWEHGRFARKKLSILIAISTMAVCFVGLLVAYFFTRDPSVPPKLANELHVATLPDSGTSTSSQPRITPDDDWIDALPTGTWQINFLSGAQRPVTLTSLTEGEMLLRAGGTLSGRYRWDGKQLSMLKPEDKRYQKLVWKKDGDDLVLVEEPPDHPSGARYIGTRMRFFSDDTSSETQDLIEKKASRLAKPKSSD